MEKLCNSDFERAVLGGMIKYKGIIEEYEGELSPSLFRYDDSKDIYEAISLKTCVEKRLTLGAPGPEVMNKVIGLYDEYMKDNQKL